MPNRSIVVTLNVLGLLVASNGYWFPQSKADLEPVDPLVFVGETLKVQCRLTDSKIQASSYDMYFEVASHYVTPSWTVLLENITIVDNKTISAYINITEAFSNTTTVFCKYKNMNQGVDLRSGYIHVEKPIRNITNFSAVYYYFGNMELSWILGESYLSEKAINVTVDWNASAPPDKPGASCDKMTAESCVIRPSGQDYIFVRINVTSTKYERPSAEFLEPLYNRSAISVIEICVDDYTKTQPPGNLREIDKNSTCANLTWDDPLYFVASKLETLYEVTITKKDDRSTNIKESKRPVGQNYITVCSLHPFTTHIVSVRIKGRKVNPWSDPAFTEVTTAEDRPLTGPPLNSTSYHSEDCVDNEMLVIVFWNDPLKSSLRGELTQFEFVVDNVSTSLRKGSNYHKTRVSCGTEHEVLIYSVTKVGNSVTPSDIIIPRKVAELPALNDVTVRMDEVQESPHTDKLVNVTVAWDPGPLAERSVTLVLYMCQESSDPFTCLNDFSTREISVDRKEVLLSDLRASMSLFGYALIDDQGNKRGIEWISCVYRAKQVPNRPAPVKVNAGTEANTLDISWTSARCDRKTKVLILHYHLFICGQLSQNYKLCPNRTVSGNRSSYTARDLVAGSTYRVYIKAESPAGLSLASQPTSGVVGVSISGSAHALDTILAVLSAVIFASIFIICCVRKCKHSKTKITTLAKNKCNIFENVKQLQQQPSQESGIDTGRSQALTVDFSLEKSLVPPVISSKNDTDLIHQICSQYTQSVDTKKEMTCDSKIDNTKDQIASTATHIHTTIPQSTGLQDVLDNLGKPHIPEKEHEHLDYGSGIPYVKMANACFSSGTDASTVAVDEGYNSPDADIGTPVFSDDRLQTMLASRAPSSPVCRNGIVPSFSPSSQIVFTCVSSSLVSCQGEKLQEPNVSFFPPHSRRTWQEPGVIMNSPHCHIIPERNISPQSQIPETHLSMKSPQSQIPETHLSMKSPQSQIPETHLSLTTPQSQLVLPTISTSPLSQHSLAKHRETVMSPKPTNTMNNSLKVYDVSGPTQHGCQPSVNFQGSNAKATSLDKCSQVKLCNKSNGTSIDSTRAYDITESSDLCRGDNSNQQIISGYVTCGIDGKMNLKTAEVSELESTDLGNVFSPYKPNCHTSQNMTIPEDSRSVNSGYKSLEFLDNSATLGLINQGGFGTHASECVGQEGVGDLGRFVDQGELDGEGRFGTCKENFGNQSTLPDSGELDSYVTCTVADEVKLASYVTCTIADQVTSENMDSALEQESAASVNRFSDYAPNCQTNINRKDKLDSYVTCTITDQVTSENMDSALEQESAASLNRFSDYAPNCQTNINRKDAFSENEFDGCVSQSSEIRQMSAVVADDEGNIIEGYRDVSFLENSHGFDFGDQEECGVQKEYDVRQADFGIQNENFGHQGELNIINEKFVSVGGCPLEENSKDFSGEVDGQTSDYVSQHFTDTDLNHGVDNFMLKPAHLGNNDLSQMEILPEQSASKNISFERNDLYSTSADAMVDLSVSEGGYVSHFELSTQGHPGDGHSSALLDAGCRRQTEEISQIIENPDTESSQTVNDFGYVSVNSLAGGVML